MMFGWHEVNVMGPDEGLGIGMVLDYMRLCYGPRLTFGMMFG